MHDDDASRDEFPDEADTDHGDEESVDTQPCPHCGREVYDQASACPYCGTDISPESTPNRTPLWIVLTAVACLLAILLFWISRGW